MASKKVTVSLNQDVYLKLKAKADQEYRSVASVLREIVANHVMNK